MSTPTLRILIPALIASADDVRRLTATLAGLPPGLDAVAHPLIQSSWSGFDRSQSRLLRPWTPPVDGERLASAPVRIRPTVPFADLPPAPKEMPFADLPPPASAPFTDAPPVPLAPHLPVLPVEPFDLGSPRGKWDALREGLARVGPAPWIVVADGDDAYDLVVLPALLWRAEEGEGDLFQGARGRIVLDTSALARRRALLEPVVNELLRARLAPHGVTLAPDVTDLQSGLFCARRELLAQFLAQPRMDGATEREAPGELPWGAYGGELHLHAFAARHGARVRAHPVRERPGRESGQTPAAIGAQLRASVLFAGAGARELETAVAAAAARGGWGAGEIAAATAAAREAFPAAG